MALDYLSWNDRLAAHFFRPENAGRRIFLYINPSELEQVSEGERQDHFVAAVIAGPPWITRHRQGVCQKALQAGRGWRERNREFPPYIAYLALFVLAAGIDGEFASHAYYPRLRALLGEDSAASQYPSFDDMLTLWDDLERWANEEKEGKLGIFRSEIAGGWIHVGLPVAQTILTQHERDCLPALFSESGLAPGTPASEEQVAIALLANGRNRLRRGTIRLLESERNNTARQLLLQTAREELEDWDGSCRNDEQPSQRTSGALRLCLAYDSISGRASVRMRCKTGQEFPEGGLSLHCEQIEELIVCRDNANGWSTLLAVEDTHAPLDPRRLDWTRQTSMRTEDGGWILRHPASPVRIFENGGPYGLPDFIESIRLPASGSFYLICHNTASKLIQEWGHSSCAAFDQLPLDSGLPADWSLFSGRDVQSDRLVRNTYPSLALDSTVGLRCEGGVQHSRNGYFTFGLPRVLLEGSADGITLRGGSKALVATELANVFDIPSESAESGKITIEAIRGDEVVARKNLYISDDPVTQPAEPVWLDAFGNPLNDAGEGVVWGTEVRGSYVDSEMFFIPELRGATHFVLLGRIAGQIAEMPDEGYPRDWQPVWAIVRGRRNTAYFCGTGLPESEPSVEKLLDIRRVRRWKEILWHGRKRTAAPPDAALVQIWERYQRVAGAL